MEILKTLVWKSDAEQQGLLWLYVQITVFTVGTCFRLRKQTSIVTVFRTLPDSATPEFSCRSLLEFPAGLFISSNGFHPPLQVSRKRPSIRHISRLSFTVPFPFTILRPPLSDNIAAAPPESIARLFLRLETALILQPSQSQDGGQAERHSAPPRKERPVHSCSGLGADGSQL